MLLQICHCCLQWGGGAGREGLFATPMLCSIWVKFSQALPPAWGISGAGFAQVCAQLHGSVLMCSERDFPASLILLHCPSHAQPFQDLP